LTTYESDRERIEKASLDCHPANRLYRCMCYMGRDGMARGSAHVMFLLCCLAVVSISAKWRCVRRATHKQNVC